MEFNIGDKVIFDENIGGEQYSIPARHKLMYQPPTHWKDEIKSFMITTLVHKQAQPTLQWLYLKNWFKGRFTNDVDYEGQEFPFNNIFFKKL